MNKLFFYAFVLVTLLLVSCNSNNKKSINGLDVTFFEDKNGKSPKEGDWVFFHYYIMSKDSLLFSSNMQSPIIKFQLPKHEKVSDVQKVQPLIDLLYMMSKGDSAMISQKTDPQMRKAMSIPKIGMLEYHVKLVDINSNEK